MTEAFLVHLMLMRNSHGASYARFLFAVDSISLIRFS